MGWNSFDAYGLCLNEPLALRNLEVMARRLLPAGYRTFVVDMGWYFDYPQSPGLPFPRSDATPALCIDPYGRYVPGPLFPHGMQSLAQRAHELGLCFGLHLMRGIPRQAVAACTPILGSHMLACDIADASSTCRWSDVNYGIDVTRPGASEYLRSVVDLLASWEVDFLKADDIVPYPLEIDALADALEQQPRPIALSLSPGNTVCWDHLDAYNRADMVRLTRDVWDRRVSLDRCFQALRAYAEQGGAAFWPDLDMIPLGELRVCLPAECVAPGRPLPSEGVKRSCQWSLAQQQTFLSLLAIASSPMFFGGDLLTSPEAAFELVTQPDVIACNQHGVTGRLVLELEGVEVWGKSRENDPASGWLAVFNRTEYPVQVALSLTDLQLPPGIILREAWTNRLLVTGNDWMLVDLAADGVAFYQVGL